MPEMMITGKTYRKGTVYQLGFVCKCCLLASGDTMILILNSVPGDTSWAHCKSDRRKLLKRHDGNTSKMNRESMFCQMEQ